MKKIKKMLSLTLVSLVMGGMIFSLPQNTTTVSADVVPTDPKYYYEEQIPIREFYRQRLCFKTIKRGTSFKPYAGYMLEVGYDGMLKMSMHDGPVFGCEFDDDYTFVVFDKDLNLRFRFDTNYKCENTVYKELDKLSREFNNLQVGVGNYLGVVGRAWNGTVLFDTREGFTALKRTGHNRFEKGYSDVNVKFSTLLKVTDDGLQEFTTKWIDRVWKKVTV